LAVTHKLYGNSMLNSANGNIPNMGSTASAEIYVKLMTSAHTFAVANQYWADVSANEQSTATASSTDYITGGKLLTNTSLAYAARITTLSATSETVFSTGGNISGFHAVLTASSYLVSCVDFGGEEKSVAGEFKINWADSKILTITVAS
jgi:hypothetical protein